MYKLYCGLSELYLHNALWNDLSRIITACTGTFPHQIYFTVPQTNVLRSDQNFVYILKRFVVFPNDASADPTRKCGGKAMTQGQQRQYRQCSAVSLFVTNLGKFKSK